MGHGIVSGVNWTVEGRAFTIFDQRGFVDGNKWVVPVEFFGNAPAKVNPGPISGDIENIIAQDVRAGNDARIAYVGVGPFQGLLLALEGVITLPMLQAAEETPERIIMEVTLGGKQRKLIIQKDLAYTMATFDENDEVV